MNLFDTHCHLYSEPLASDIPAVLGRAAAVGVTRVIVPAYDPASWDAIAAMVGLSGVNAALGLHPWVADAVPAAGIRDLLLSQQNRKIGPVAIGEIGLDTKLPCDGPTLAVQLAVLRPQLELAHDLDLPVILHCRGAFEELLTELDRFGGRLRGVLHAWSRGPELAERFTRAGLALGLGGAVTREHARRVRRTVRRLPLDHFVLETDAPSIGLDGILPEHAEPAHVADVARAVADIRGESLETVAAATTAHACRLFGLEETP